MHGLLSPICHLIQFGQQPMLMMIISLIEHTPGQTVAFVYVFLQSEQYVSEISVIHSIFYLYGPAVLQRYSVLYAAVKQSLRREGCTCSLQHIFPTLVCGYSSEYGYRSADTRRTHPPTRPELWLLLTSCDRDGGTKSSAL